MRAIFSAGLLLTILFLSGNPASAQSDSVQIKPVKATQVVPGNSPKNRLWAAKFIPQHLLINGYSFEIERRVSAQSNHSFTLSPRYFNGKTKLIDKLSGRQSGYDAGTVSGYGVEFLHRIYRPDPLKPGKQQYIAYGFNFHQFDVDFAIKSYGKVIEKDGLEYYRNIWHPKQAQVERIGGIVMFGAQNPIFNSRFVTDIYGGIGIRSSGSNNALNHFDANILDFGSSGFYLAMGVKLGYTF